jgi:hypothetical protein
VEVDGEGAADAGGSAGDDDGHSVEGAVHGGIVGRESSFVDAGEG